MAARQVTIYDTYFFDDFPPVDIQEFADVIARHFREPEQGLGFDNSPVAPKLHPGRRRVLVDPRLNLARSHGKALHSHPPLQRDDCAFGRLQQAHQQGHRHGHGDQHG